MPTLTPTTAQSWPVRIPVFLHNKWIDISLTAYPIVITVCTVAMSDEVTTRLLQDEANRTLLVQTLVLAIICSTLLYFYVILCHWKMTKNFSEVESENIDLKNKITTLEQERHEWVIEYRELLREYLHDFCYLCLKFSSEQHNTERLTFFVHDSDHHFVPIIRISSNPRFAKLGREKIPDNQGCLGKAWEHDWFTVDLNDPETKTYEKQSKELGISEDTLSLLRMKSRYYVGSVVRRPSDEKRIGVIMVESTKASRWYDSTIRSTFDQGSFSAFLTRLSHRVVVSMQSESNVSTF